ncbi:D-2-hydroxyacid dehydrogenase [Metabacillus halosaccharovorans]|uniref:D-2-hydroxyacid dehydrogenase n=1 Tax=Metabacillus halosaccharovorans TaxID=930124 RepID=UPI001C1F64F0|nr:D-2-hydroxyacid dehydrogenase [Metabacillus halosaccharovorans]MBU7595758.1 D-2-hydroxyacid dehydrogenase [Metabacillus halosaccharovorans]
MQEIYNALVTTYLTPENEEKLRKALEPAEVVFCKPNETEVIAEAIKKVDVAILNSDVDDLILTGPNLRWIHCCRAGLDKSAKPEIFERGIILTSSSGRSAPALAEHAMMFMLTLTYDIPQLMKAKAERRWAATREYSFKTGMYGKTVGILGLGKTGCEVARLAKMFDMKVLGWRRSTEVPENVDVVYSSDRQDSLQTLLESSDYVILCAELNDDTWHMLDKKEFDWMKPSSFVINMGRGELIDESVMIEALKHGKIAGAGLDTFEVEPLPNESPLWDMENVIITPHITPRLPDREERAMEYVYQNIEAYRKGSGFVNRLSQRNMYTKNKVKG